MKRIIAFGASNSRSSINARFAKYTAGLVDGAKVEMLDLNDYEMPIYSIDRERKNGIPKLAYVFKEHLLNADGIIISLAEHNGSYAVAFKNIVDWVSRIEKDVWSSKPMLLLATAPGGRGGKTVLDIALNRFGRMNKNLVGGFSLPLFRTNFNDTDGVTDDVLKEEFQGLLKTFEAAVFSKSEVEL